MKPLPPETEAEIRDVGRTNKVYAIKLYREATGVGLAEAKEAVEKMVAESSGNASLPGNAPAKGCFGMIAVAVLVGAGAVARLVLV